MSIAVPSLSHWSKDAIANLERLAVDNPDLKVHYSITIAKLRGMAVIDERLARLLSAFEHYVGMEPDFGSASPARDSGDGTRDASADAGVESSTSPIEPGADSVASLILVEVASSPVAPTLAEGGGTSSADGPTTSAAETSTPSVSEGRTAPRRDHKRRHK
jgi:hypothetical protein